MPHRRRFQKGSFGSHFDELVKHFPPANPEARKTESPKRSPELEEKISIHALLFRRAWQVDTKDPWQ